MTQQCCDMVVSLTHLSPGAPLNHDLRVQNICIRRALAPERSLILDWVKQHFSQQWRDECAFAVAAHPLRCFIATYQNKIVGFCIYDAIAKGTLGPLGVERSYRGRKIGKALLISTLEDMRTQGYAYAILGWVGDKGQEFYKKTVQAQKIENSLPEKGMYKGLLTRT